MRYTTTTAMCGHQQSTYGLIHRCPSIRTPGFAEHVVESALCSRCYAKVKSTPKGCVTPLGRETIVKRQEPMSMAVAIGSGEAILERIADDIP